MDSYIKNATMSEQIWNFKGKVDYVDNWLFMKNPLLLIFITSFYLTFVLKFGPTYMKDRPPFKVTKLLILYNTFQVLFSVYLCFIGTNLIWTNGLLCPSCLMDKKESGYLITTSSYAYLMAKVSELIDTIFFVLRKKNNQVTFLHVYHHSMMMWSTWLTLKYEPTYSTIFLGTLNSYVHVIMYTYYGLSAFQVPEKYLWWKRYITSLQLTQFVLILLHAVANIKYSGCPPSNTLLITIFVNATLFIYLFGKFYINSYLVTKGKNVKFTNNNMNHDIKNIKKS